MTNHMHQTSNAMKGASIVHWSYPIHVYLIYPHKSRMMGMLLKNWRLWQGELGIHSLDIRIVLYQNSQNEVVYEQVQDTQHDTTDLKVYCYHDKYNDDCMYS